MTKKIHSIFMAATLLVAAVATTGCKKDEPQQQGKVQKYHMSINASKGDNGDKANGPKKVLSPNGSTISATWATTDEISVYNVTKSAALTGSLKPKTAGAEAILEGELTGTIENGDELTLKFLSPDNYSAQTGTLDYIAANCDYAIASVIVASVDGSGNITTTDDAEFANQQAIVKFSLTDGSEAINVKPLVIEVAGSTYTINPASATDELYVALPGFSSQTISMTATVGSDTYTFEKSDVTLANGQYYTISVGMTAVPTAPTGAINGLFSVGESTQVHFSQGNLQYQASTQTWRFAENQYDYIGDDNSNISASYSGWIDFFGWGTGNNPTNSSISYSDYSTFVEWGVNAISNGGNEANLWRTLTKDEWVYLFYTRTNAANLFGLGSVNGVNGTIILPDNWVTPEGASFTPSTTQGLVDQGSYYGNSNGNNFSHNTYTVEQWSVMEQSGAVFLPAAGDRGGTVVHNVGSIGYYWSSTPNVESSAYRLYFDSDDLNPLSSFSRYYGRSVRLVR